MAVGLFAPIAGIPLLTSGRNLTGFEAAHPPKFILDGNMDTFWKPDSFSDSALYIDAGTTKNTRISAIALWIHNYNEDFTGKRFQTYRSNDDIVYTLDFGTSGDTFKIEDFRAPFSPLFVYPLPVIVDDHKFRRISFVDFDTNVPIGVKPEISAWWLLEDYSLADSHQPDIVKQTNVYHNRNNIINSGIRFNSSAGIGLQRALERHFIVIHSPNLQDAHRAAQGSLKPIFMQADHNSTAYTAMHFVNPLQNAIVSEKIHDINQQKFIELGHKRIPYQDRRLFPLSDTIGLWRFNDISGTDVSGQNNNLTNSGFDSTDILKQGITERGDTVLETDTVDRFTIASGAPSVDFEMDTSDFTIETWGLIKSTITGSDRFFFQKMTFSPHTGWNVTHDGLFRWGCNLGDGVTGQFHPTTVSHNDDKWHLITAVFDRTAGTLDFYIDGIFNVSRDISAITGNISQPTAAFILGGRIQANQVLCDEICITKRKLTAVEILDRYNGRETFGDVGM